MRGLQLPIRAEIAETAGEIKDGLVGWDDFAELLKVAVNLPSGHPTKTTGQVSAKESFLTGVWAGTMTPTEWAEQRNSILNQGIIDYKAANPDVDYSKYAADPNFDRTIK